MPGGCKTFSVDQHLRTHEPCGSRSALTRDRNVPIPLLVAIHGDIGDIPFVQRLIHVAQRQRPTLGLGRLGVRDTTIPFHIKPKQRFGPRRRARQRDPPGRGPRHGQRLEPQPHQPGQGGIEQTIAHGVDHAESLGLNAESTQGDRVGAEMTSSVSRSVGDGECGGTVLVTRRSGRIELVQR